ncbi:mucin-17 isoform X2 [Eurosta solidaginis]|uniref:mucin-17 isoform X2 n=1 Tax=Eurosta solidaginis TaxID=178769 RepID=UPI0035309741
MAEKLKGDTSCPATVNSTHLAATQAVKNPLLSASVTGLTFDDFPNKPLLLPPVAINRDPKPLVTIGSRTDVDTENLDEINLNTTNEETQSTSNSAANIAHIDANANQLWTNVNNQPTDSILSQAASSFSALPSVASSVLSTFSKRISEYSGSNSRERTPTSDNANIASQLDIQPAYLTQQQYHIQPPPPPLIQQHQQQPSTPQQYSLYNNSPQTSSLTSLPTVFASTAVTSVATSESNATTLPTQEPPKLYTPSEVPILPAVSSIPPTSASGQNTYRLAAKKKLYAPIPGLSEQHTVGGFSAPSTLGPLSSTSPLQGYPPLPIQPATPIDPFGYPTQTLSTQFNPYDPNQQTAQSLRQEEKKAGGLFANISNLVPTGVLSNISGLVQTATGSFTPSPNKSTGEELGQQPFYGYQQTPSGSGITPPAQHQSYSTPSVDLNQSAGKFFTPAQISQFPSTPAGVTQFDARQAAPAHIVQQTSHLFSQPSSVPNQAWPPPPTTGFVAAPPKSATPESIKQRPSASTTPITFFDPTKQPSTAGIFGTTEPISATNEGPTSAAAQLTEPSLPPSVVSTVNNPLSLFQPTQSPFSAPPGELASTAAVQQQSNQQPQLTAIQAAASLPAESNTSIFSPQPSVTTNQSHLPPTAVGSTSFRLQKGTRLYKSPLTSAETAPVQVQAGGLIQPLAPPVSFFNPFGSAAPTSQPNPQFSTTVAPEAPTLVPSYFIPQQAESSVGLFAVENQEKEKKVTDIHESHELGTSKHEESQLYVPTTVERNGTSTEPSLLGEDIGALIQQQTIEAILPEVVETTNLGSAEHIPTETASKASNQSETFPKALEELALKEIESEQKSIQHLPTESADSTKHIVQENQEPQVPEQSTELVNTAIGPLKFPKATENPLSELEPKLLLPVSTLQPTSFVQPAEQKQAPPPLPSLFPKPTEGNPLLPPSLQPANTLAKQSQNSNPFRRSVGATPFAPVPKPSNEAQPKLANFFVDALGVPKSGAAEFKLFAPPTPQLFPCEQQPAKAIQSETSPSAPVASTTVSSAAGLFGFVDPTQQLSQLPPVFDQNNTSFPPLPEQIGIAPPALTQESPPTVSELDNEKLSLGIPPPIGFDNLVSALKPVTAAQFGTEPATAPLLPSADITVQSTALPTGIVQVPSSLTSGNSETQHSGVDNSFSNYFNQSESSRNEQQQKLETTKIVAPSISATSPAHFFDTFAQPQVPTHQEEQQQSALKHKYQTQDQTNEDQRLQNFFNNPPQRENNAGIGDLGYDLVHSGLTARNSESLTTISKIVEPPSSSCSEFSEWNNSNVSTRTFPVDIFAKRSTEKILTVVQPQLEVPQSQVPSATAPEIGESVADTNTDSPNTLSALRSYAELPEEISSQLRMANMLIGEKAAASAPPNTLAYLPAVKHWFYKHPNGNNKFVWRPFSHYDSALLETTLNMDNAPNIVAVEGGRYDVNIKERTKAPVYWEGAKMEVRRCSWFYKGTDSKMVPYEEAIADLLENEYKQAVASGEWHKKIVLSMHEQVTFHGPTVIVHFQQQQSSDAWGGTSQTTTRPRVVKRDLDDFIIEQGESQRVDHLLLMVHGIGAACDLKMRSVDEVVDDFRQIAQNLVQSHYKNSTEMGLVGRVEVLPISWYSHLHSDEMGIDEKLRSITLESIPKLRSFTNNTILDVLLYTSPKFCQKIMNRVASSMNEVYNKYRERHPEFNGGVSVSGHSLGSLIVFDLLCHQKAPKDSEENLENPDQLGTSPMDISNDDSNVTSYTMGHAGTGQPFIHYAQLSFQPKKFFALGSPIGMFVTIRGIDNLGLDFRLPTCAGFYNIFHPFDPVAYRVEALVNPDMSGVRPVLIPHHKGRKRMHLELKETMTRVGADLKQRFLETFKTTLESMNFLGVSTRSNREAEENIAQEVDAVLSMQIATEKQLQQIKQSNIEDNQQPSTSQANNETTRTRSDSVSTSHSDSDLVEIDFPLGKLNDSKRIDYVLQEAPLEFINEYIFAMGAHVCYWESEDTILFVMKEIYTGLGISPDNQVPQQTMTIERPSSRNSNTLSPINEKR